MKKILFFAAVAAVALTGCSKEDANNGSAASGNEISMRAVLEKTTNGRASAMTVDRFSSFHVIAYWDAHPSFTVSEYLNVGVFRLEKDPASPWSYGAKAYYPAEGNLHFFAYSPISDQNMTTPLNYDGSIAEFEYTVPADQSEKLAEDLLVAKNEINTPDVSFTFEHALSAATFAAVNENEKGSGLIYVIKKIEITNLANQGRFNYLAIPNWSDNGFKVDYIAPLPLSGVALEPTATDQNGNDAVLQALLTENDFLLIMPQIPDWGTTPEDPLSGSTTYVKLTYSFSDSNGNYFHDGDYAEHYFAIPTSNDLHEGFKAGKRYDFTFSFDHLKGITMSAKVNEWDTPPNSPVVVDLDNP